MNPMLRLAAAATALLALAACGPAERAASQGSASQTPESQSAGYPVTVDNCDAEVSFPAAPERVVLLKSAAVPFLHSLGVMDRVTARAGEYPADYYDAATQSELDAIEPLTGKTDTSGHLQISPEIVIGQEPDLVLGEVENLSRATLAGVDIPLLEEPALCAEGVADPSFDDVYAQMEMYGQVFDRSGEAAAANAALQQRLDAITAAVPDTEDRTAAVLYPTVGGGTTYAYGTKSMAQPQLEAAGFRNVFDDVEERVFEVTPEELLGRNPDVLILLHTEGDPAAVEQAVRALPSADQLTAVRNGDLMPQLFNFTEPPTPLSVTGLERIVARFAR